MQRVPVRVGLLGCGHVGGALARLLVTDGGRISARTGLDLQLAAVAVRSLARHRELELPDGVLGPDPRAVVSDPSIDIVVEVIGGIEPARGLILDALKSGKAVVTANKELLANCGPELFEAAAAAGVDLLFEAAVAGGIPLIRPLRESLAGERILRVMGIVNGTTNYILSRMTESGASFEDALVEAQGLGFAERDPTADVEGFDAAAKAAILANVAFGARVVAGDVYREGIDAITTADIAVARRMGYVIKLLAVVEADPSGATASISVRVHPAMVPANHPLASVRDSFNAVFVVGEALGDLMLLGRGAGGMPTASAVLGDVLDAAHNRLVGGAGRSLALRQVPLRPIDDVVSAYYLTLAVADRPGVLHAVSGVLGANRVSIRSMEQEASEKERTCPDDARLVFVTHPAVERDVRACLDDLRQLDAVHRVGSLIRVVEG
ncbi:MAG: homoserine dehydrogenase [Acidimicrobiales bacterium]